MWKRRPGWVAAAALIVAVLVAGSSSAGQNAASSRYDISMVDYSFLPKDATVFAGSTVVWTNNSPLVPHTSTGAGTLWDSGFLSAGLIPPATFSRTFDSVGTFPYVCSLHQLFFNMSGTVTVIAAPTERIFLPLLVRNASPL